MGGEANRSSTKGEGVFGGVSASQGTTPHQRWGPGKGCAPSWRNPCYMQIANYTHKRLSVVIFLSQLSRFLIFMKNRKKMRLCAFMYGKIYSSQLLQAYMSLSMCDKHIILGLTINIDCKINRCKHSSNSQKYQYQ